MIFVLDCAGLSPFEHAAVAAAIRHVDSDAVVHEIDDQRARRFDPATAGAVASIVSAVCASVAVVLQALQVRRDGRRASKSEAEEAILRVEVTLNERIDVSVRQNLVTELQKLPDPVRIYLPDGISFYEVTAVSSKELVSMKGQPASATLRDEPTRRLQAKPSGAEGQDTPKQ
jgi:hypothetical protein